MKREVPVGWAVVADSATDGVIRDMLDSADHIASTMGRKWGVGRLRLLVNEGLRVRFDAQLEKLDAAIAANSEPEIRVHAEAMKRAWAMLDRIASDAGHPHLAPEIWE